MSIFQRLIFAMNKKLKLYVLFWFYYMVYKPPALELNEKGVERTKGGLAKKRDDLLIQACLKTRFRLI